MKNDCLSSKDLLFHLFLMTDRYWEERESGRDREHNGRYFSIGFSPIEDVPKAGREEVD